MMKRYFLLIVLILTLLLAGQKADASDITFAWDAPTAGVPPTGYKLYWGTAPGNYTQSVDMGKPENNTYTLKTLDISRGGIWYFAATAYAGSIESVKSNEVIVGVPGAPNLKVSIIMTFSGQLQ
jgi:hypothetical protein